MGRLHCNSILQNARAPLEIRQDTISYLNYEKIPARGNDTVDTPRKRPINLLPIVSKQVKTYPPDCRKIAAVDSNKLDWD